MKKKNTKTKQDPYRQQRREIPPPPQVHRDRTKYTRNEKHKGRREEE